MVLPRVFCRDRTVTIPSKENVFPKEFLAAQLYLPLAISLFTKCKCKDEFPPTEEKPRIDILSFNQPITGVGKPAAEQDKVTFSSS